MLRRFPLHMTGLRWTILAIITAIVLPIAWYLGSPLFLNTTINEDFPTSGQPQITGGQIETPTMPAPSNEAATEPTPSIQPTSIPTSTQAEAITPTSRPAPTEPPAPASPIALGSGTFGVVDAIHKGSGTATIYTLPDGERVLRFEDFNVTNGPDLYVYLSGHPAPRSSEQLHEGADFEVARLKGNIGNQNYELPADLDLSQFKSVVIYCRRFSVVFSTAELISAS
jgi:hypothetical protein